MASYEPEGRRYCGRLFTTDEIQRICSLTAAEPKRNRAQLSREVCDILGWLRPDGRPKEMGDVPDAVET